MTAVISRERARTTGLTAVAGMLMLAVAFVMMVAAAPGHGPARAQLARPPAVRLMTDVCHQLTSRSDRGIPPAPAAPGSGQRLQSRYSSSVTCSPQ